MDPITQQTVLAAAGAAGGDKVYVDDVFSTYLYDGNGGTQSINNGIDLAGEGGLVWFKKRNAATYGGLWDTERGVTKRLRTDTSNATDTASNLVTSFNSNGVSISATGGTQINNTNDNYVSWSFRKAPGFFDVVTWTGSGSDKTISHNLGSVPGCIMVKCTSHSSEWYVYHRSLPTSTENWLRLSNTAAANGPVGQDVWGPPSSTTFKADTYLGHSTVGRTYVAYIFAHDDASFGTDEDESIIKCGSVTTNGSPQEINLGFEPQWLLLKKYSETSSWYLIDNLRGFTANDHPVTLKADVEDAEGGLAYWRITSTGIKFTDTDNGTDWIYVAIRRPNKPPESATEVFATQDGRSATNGTASQNTYTSGFPVDLIMRHTKASDNTRSVVFDRLRGEAYLLTHETAVETSGDFIQFDNMDGVHRSTVSANTGLFAHMFKRAPGFFDVVTYAGNSTSGATVAHNLGVVPEMMVIKGLDYARSWRVWESSFSNGALSLNAPSAKDTNTAYFSTPTATNIVLGTDNDTNRTGYNYIAYLFATLPGISKVGSYTGTGSDINVDCGFTNGARFVLIKRTDSTADWFLYDTARGISSGDDPYLKLNLGEAQVTNTDYIDPLSSGFIANGNSADINASGGTYIFLAIA